jgi:phage gp29-like protein
MRHYLAKAAFAVARAFGAEPIVERASLGAKGARVIPDQALWAQYQRIGGALTPQRVSQILREADTGETRQYIDLLNDSRQKDGHLQGILSQVEESIAELDWTLTVPDNAKGRKRNQKIVAFVTEALRSTTGSSPDDTKGFGDLISHLSGSFYYGHAVSEILWKKDDVGYLVPKGFELLNARRFGYRQSDGAFIWRDETTTYQGIRIQEDYPNRFIVAQPRVNGDLPSREGLGRVLMWAALFRNWSLSDWLRTAELSWKPWRVGYYEKGASEPDKTALAQVMESLMSSGSAILADTTKFDVHWPGGSGGSGSRPTHAELFNVIAQEMSKAALGATETVQSSSSSGYAQAKVHAGVSKTILRARARQIAMIIMRDLIRPMVEMNFGRKALVPTFSFVLPDPVDIAQFGKGIKDLVEAGLKLPQTWVRARIGAPEPLDEEDVLEPQAPEPDPPEDPNAPTPDAPDGGGEDTADVPADDGEDPPEDA